VLPKVIVRRLAPWLIALAVLGSACTPEAIEVDPATGGTGAAAPSAGKSSSGGHVSTGSGGNSTSQNEAGQAAAGEPTGGEPSGGTSVGGGGSGGSGTGGTGGNPADCAALSSTQGDCAACLTMKCSSEVKACATTPCSCKPYGGYTGQMNCLLACLPSGASPQQADACANNCGFQDLMHADQTTHALFDCLVNPPQGPPSCPQCLGK
jgi:hypothetical protein